MPHAPSTHRVPLLVALACAAGLAAGCASEQPPRFHSLLSTSPADTAAADPAAKPLFIDLGLVTVPPSVDQPQWVVRTADDTLRMLEQERWVAPLRDELRAALVEGLTRRWGATDVRTTAAPAGAGWRLRVDVLRFETVAGSGAWLDSAWSATAMGPAGTALTCRSQLRESSGADPVSLAAAHRRAAGRLADQIGETLKALNAGQKGACPAGDAG